MSKRQDLYLKLFRSLFAGFWNTELKSPLELFLLSMTSEIESYKGYWYYGIFQAWAHFRDQVSDVCSDEAMYVMDRSRSCKGM